MGQAEHEKLCGQLVDDCSEAIVVSDRRGVITIWNQAAQRILGFTADEALGESLNLFIPENQRPRHWEGYYKVMETGVTGYATKLLTAPAICKDGSRISTEFSMTLLKNEAGQITAVAAIVRDVTERWQKEKALRGRIAELEKAGE